RAHLGGIRKQLRPSTSADRRPPQRPAHGNFPHRSERPDHPAHRWQAHDRGIVVAALPLTRALRTARLRTAERHPLHWPAAAVGRFRRAVPLWLRTAPLVHALTAGPTPDEFVRGGGGVVLIGAGKLPRPQQSAS